MKQKSKNRVFKLILAFALMSITQCDLVAQHIQYIHTQYVWEPEADMKPKINIPIFYDHTINNHHSANVHQTPDPYSHNSLGSYYFNAKEEERRAAEQKAQAERYAEESRRLVKEEQERQAAREAEEELRRKQEERDKELMHILQQQEERKRQEQAAQAQRNEAIRQAAAKKAREEQEAKAAEEKARAEQEAKVKQDLERENLEKLKAEEILKEQREYAEILDFEADSSHLVQKLENFNTLFIGLQAPNIESFNNLMASFMGKDLSAAHNAANIDPSDLFQAFKNFNAFFANSQALHIKPFNGLIASAVKDLLAAQLAANTVPIDSNIVGDYILTSFKYHDENADVYMEIGRVLKIDDCVMSSEADMNWDELSEGYFDVTGINVSQQSQEVTFALQEGSDKIILKTDLNSMSNYIAQKTMEGYIFFDPNAVNKIPVDLDKIPTHGLKDTNPTFARQAASIIVDFIPWIGTTKSISELIFGYDPISGERIHRVVAAFGIVTSIVPIPGAAKGGKLVGKALVMTTDFLGKKSNHVIEKNFTRLVKLIPREAPEILKKFRPQYEAVKAFSEAGYKGASRYYVLIEDRIVHAGEIIKQLAPRIQERLKHMRIPDKPLVPGGGLLHHELYKGNHSIRDHVGQTQTDFFARRAAGNKNDLSSFNDLEEAEYFVAETIRRNQSKIQKWLKTAKRTQRFEASFEKTTGILLKKGEQSVQNVQRVRVVLNPAKETPEGYTVYTTFPVE